MKYFSKKEEVNGEWYTEAKVGTPRCGVPAPCRRGTGASLRDRFGALGTESSAAERGGDGAARHPYLCLIAPGRNGHEMSELDTAPENTFRNGH